MVDVKTEAEVGVIREGTMSQETQAPLEDEQGRNHPPLEAPEGA